MVPPPPKSSLFPYTTLFRSRLHLRRPARSPARYCERRTSALNSSCISRSVIPGFPWWPEWPRDRPCRRSTKRSEEHTSELQSHVNLVCRLLLEKKKKKTIQQ